MNTQAAANLSYYLARRRRRKRHEPQRGYAFVYALDPDGQYRQIYATNSEGTSVPVISKVNT